MFTYNSKTASNVKKSCLISNITYPFIRRPLFVSVTVYVIVSALPFRNAVAVALSERIRKN